MMPALTAKSVVVPVDLSPDSIGSLLSSIGSLSQAGRVRLVHVLGPAAADTDDESRRVAVDAARETLQSLIDHWGLEHTSAVVLEGDVGEAVGRFAAATHADAILVPSRRQLGRVQFLTGPKAARIVHSAPCPVFMLWNQPAMRPLSGGNHEERQAA